MSETSRPLAIVTGASSGIGLELAKLAVDQGYDLIIAADEPEIHQAAGAIEAKGAKVRAVHADLATRGVSTNSMMPRESWGVRSKS